MIGHASGGMLDRGLDEQAVLVEIHRRRFARGADDDDAVGAFGDVPVDQLAKRLEIERAVFLHRRHDRNQTTLQSRHVEISLANQSEDSLGRANFTPN